jgi:hypothetical protein
VAPEQVTPEAAAPEAPIASTEAPVPSAGVAPHDEVLSVVYDLLKSSPSGVMLDAVARRLKDMGFVRPPNSPRLVTRLRGFKELDVSPRGLIRAKEASATAPEATAEAAEDAREEGGGAPEGAAKRRRRRRGGRSRGKSTPPAPEGASS